MAKSDPVTQYRRLIQSRIELCRWKAHALYLERERTALCWESQRATLAHRVKALRKVEKKLVDLRASVLDRFRSDNTIHFEHSLNLGVVLNAPLAMALHASLTNAPMDILAMERERPGIISRELPAMLGRGLVEAAKAPDREGFVASLASYVVLAQDHGGDDRMALLISRGFADPVYLASFVYPDPNALESW